MSKGFSHPSHKKGHTKSQKAHENCSTSLGIREMQMKSTMVHVHTPTRMAKLKVTDDI